MFIHISLLQIKQLPREIQKSKDITFAIQIFNALDNNNYVRFFRLIREKATYLQACILLRYFNDVRARGLARIIKAYAPRGGSRYPANDLMKNLAFENIDSMKSFITHYGLHVGKTDDTEMTIILDRNQFIEDSDPFPISRAVELIESKRQCSIGEIIAGGVILSKEYNEHTLYSSFNPDGTLKDAALLAEEQGFSTKNDSNRDIEHLKSELRRIAQSGRSNDIIEKTKNVFSKNPITEPNYPDKPVILKDTSTSKELNAGQSKTFSFKPAIPVTSNEIIKSSPKKLFTGDAKTTFSFSKPEETLNSNLWGKTSTTLFEQKNLFNNPDTASGNFLSKSFGNSENKNVFASKGSQHIFNKSASNNVFLKTAKDITDGRKLSEDSASVKIKESVFSNTANSTNIFSNASIKKAFTNTNEASNIFGQQTANKNDVFLEPKNNLFSKPNKIVEKSGDNIFTKTTSDAGSHMQREQKSIFNSDSNKGATINSSNIFSQHFPQQKSELESTNTTASKIFSRATDEVQPKKFSIFQNKNILEKPSLATNIFSSVNNTTPSVYDFDNKDENLEPTILEQQQQLIDKEREMERKRQDQLKLEQEKERQRKEEERKLEEARMKAEEIRKLEEKRKKEEEKIQEALRKKIEEERKAEMKRKAEEKAKKFKERVEKESADVVEEISREICEETVIEILKDEMEYLRQLLAYADDINNELFTDLCKEICTNEMKAELHLTTKIMKKWFHLWRRLLHRNIKRRTVLENTPIWIAEKVFDEEVLYLKREVEPSALIKMNAVNKGHIFSGQIKEQLAPEPLAIIDIIRTPFLKRMKQINYPYDKCFFWKITVVSPGPLKWINNRVDVEPWLLSSFSDNEKHDISNTLIQVHKYCWNNLMDFAVSVSLINHVNMNICNEALDGSKALLFYTTENDDNLFHRIECTLSQKYPYQLLPVAVIIPSNKNIEISLEQLLAKYLHKNVISCFKLFMVTKNDTSTSLQLATKSALKWLAKMCPTNPPLEIDYLKSLSQRYLGNEFWYRLKIQRHTPLGTIFKDLEIVVKLYNTAVDKLTEILTNEDLFNYPSFPLELKKYLDEKSPYPKPYEFISSSVKCSENSQTIKDILKQLRLPEPDDIVFPESFINIQDQIRSYCNQIGWFENPEEVVSKVVAVMSNEMSEVNFNIEEFNSTLINFDLLDLLNVIVYEKINRLNNFDNRFALYEKVALKDFHNNDWWHENDLVQNFKRKLIDIDDFEYVIIAKRPKLSDESQLLTLVDADSTLVEENIKEVNEKIQKYNNLNESVHELETKLKEEKNKVLELEKLLKAALSDI